MSTTQDQALHDAINAETAARDALVVAINAENAARADRKAAEAAMERAGRKRRLAFAQVAAARKVSIAQVRAEVLTPPPVPLGKFDLPKANREVARSRAEAALRKAGGPMLAVDLGPAIGVPARAVRNYLDHDARFVIDHVRHGQRDAVRVTLAA